MSAHVKDYEWGLILSSKPLRADARRNRDRILAAAAHEFAARGYAGARVDLTCGRLDVTVGTTMMGPPPPQNPGAPGDCDP